MTTISSSFNATETEQQVLDKAVQVLGFNLADYLLSGLGEIGITHHRAFTARSTARHSEDVIYRFEMISESEQGLPRGRDPLVLAVLLSDLATHQPVNNNLRFSESKISERLGWPVSEESNLLVKRALERYLLTGFYLLDPTLKEEERIFERCARFRRLLVSCETAYYIYPLIKARTPGEIQVVFLPELNECLISFEKRFLGVEFLRLIEMQEIPVRERTRLQAEV
jgi:hypothetical protein